MNLYSHASSMDMKWKNALPNMITIIWHMLINMMDQSEQHIKEGFKLYL
jgi:hypothetical protein